MSDKIAILSVFFPIFDHSAPVVGDCLCEESANKGESKVVDATWEEKDEDMKEEDEEEEIVDEER